MTADRVAASSQARDEQVQAACAYCRRRLAGEFFFTCRGCGSSYCYIHMARHTPSACGGRVGPRRRVSPPPLVRRAEVGLLVSAGLSANV